MNTGIYTKILEQAYVFMVVTSSSDGLIGKAYRRGIP